MRKILRRFWYNILWRLQPSDSLERRVEVETYLFMCAHGKKPLPDANVCQWLAMRLGTPKRYWSDYLKRGPLYERKNCE